MELDKWKDIISVIANEMLAFNLFPDDRSAMKGSPVVCFW